VSAGVLQLLADFTRDMATVHVVMDSFYTYMDERNRWLDLTIRQVSAPVGWTWPSAR
jgi:hypothetical protein